jgi:hypothetical protein
LYPFDRLDKVATYFLAIVPYVYLSKLFLFAPEELRT